MKNFNKYFFCSFLVFSVVSCSKDNGVVIPSKKKAFSAVILKQANVTVAILKNEPLTFKVYNGAKKSLRSITFKTKNSRYLKTTFVNGSLLPGITRMIVRKDVNKNDTIDEWQISKIDFKQ